MREILDNAVLILVPSQNPDGQNLVIDHWYKTKGTPYNRNYPDLYHKYVGHDDNRDWFMFTQKETRLAIEKVQNVYRPQVTHDMHQQGATGSRIFVPPFSDPYDRNIHPIVAQSQFTIGLAMAARLVARAGTAGVPDGWSVSEHRAPSFSRSGGRLYFGTAPWEAPAPEDSTTEDEQVKVDVWHWQDADLQPTQLRRVTQERRRSYLAVAHLDRTRIVQLADTALPEMLLPYGGDGAWALANDDRADRVRTSWDTPGWQDVYAVDLDTGKRTPLLRETQSRAQLSAGGRFAYWWDFARRHTSVTSHFGKVEPQPLSSVSPATSQRTSSGHH